MNQDETKWNENEIVTMYYMYKDVKMQWCWQHTDVWRQQLMCVNTFSVDSHNPQYLFSEWVFLDLLVQRSVKF